MANERLDKIEANMANLHHLVDKLSNQLQNVLDKGKEPAHEEEYNDHEHHEGESSHSPHI